MFGFFRKLDVSFSIGELLLCQLNLTRLGGFV